MVETMLREINLHYSRRLTSYWYWSWVNHCL